MEPKRIVSRDAWLEERLALLEEEKALTQAREALAAKRRALPWVRVDVEYAFDTDQGERMLEDLFGPHDQLIVQHFMFAPEWMQGCPSCSFWSDSFQGALPHLAARGVAFLAASEAPLDRLLAYRERMGWRHDWVSAGRSRFGHDYHVTYTSQDLAAGATFYNFRAGFSYGEHAPGLSVFAKDASGAVYHTYSCYARGLDALNGTYQLLDLVPRGRDEAGLRPPQSWVRRHDEYGA